MPANIEIKAKVHDVEKLKQCSEKLSGEDGTLIVQADTFFNSHNSRLKLRELQGQPSQLISYSRSDGSGPKLSDYHITEIHNPEDLKITLTMAMGVKGVLKKHRILYMVGQTRVHVDEVEGLGSYMELEVVLKEGQTAEEGQLIAEDLMQKLNIQPDSLVKGAYMDLLLKKQNLSQQNGDH